VCFWINAHKPALDNPVIVIAAVAYIFNGLLVEPYGIIEQCPSRLVVSQENCRAEVRNAVHASRIVLRVQPRGGVDSPRRFGIAQTPNKCLKSSPKTVDKDLELAWTGSPRGCLLRGRMGCGCEEISRASISES
jgi:hypothetical protein